MTLSPNFEKGQGLLPAIVQDVYTGTILMLGFMNAEALKMTQEKKLVTFYSRTKQRLWTKGETSGNLLHLVDLKLDCDNDTFLIQARASGPTCHLGVKSCFGPEETKTLGFLTFLQGVIDKRVRNQTGYTSSLIGEGTLKCAQKLGEEATETALAGAVQSDERLLDEAADLVYHLMVLLKSRDLSLHQVVSVLEKRHQPA